MGEACRKCGGTEHYGREIIDTADSGLNVLKPGFLTTGKLDVRICGTCGLLELSVPERFLQSVRDKFQRVP